MAKKKSTKSMEVTVDIPITHTDPIKYSVVSTDLIDDPERPMRTDITEASVEDLVLSIKQMGIIEPLVVKPVNGRFEVIAGHRRLFASKLAKLLEVPCFIREANKEQTEMLKIHENMYRAEIKPADEAKHFDYLIQKQHMTPPKIAQLISKSASYVTDRLAILDYPIPLKEAMDRGEITFAVAREFARFDDLPQLVQSIRYAKVSGMTSDMARKWVHDYKTAKDQPSVTSQTTINTETNQPEVESLSTCVYCRESVKLREAAVVYMHEKCLKEANAQIVESKVRHSDIDSNSEAA